MGVVGSLGIKDNMSSVLRSVKRENQSFRKDVKETNKALNETWGKKRTAKLDASSAIQSANVLAKSVSPLRKKITMVATLKDAASAKIQSVTGKVKALGKRIASPIAKLKDTITAKLKPITSKVKALGKLVATPIVKLKDGVSAGISKIKGKIKSISKSVVIPVTIAATVAAAALGGAVKGGMQLEQQQISMEHFIGATNKDADDSTVKKISGEYMNALRQNANSTPFETADVIQAGSRAIAVASGNTKEAMSLVKLAEDMAAASGGTKTIGDAMEALADAKLGETERLKEFGFKVSAEEFDSKGFKGVSKDLGDFYGGAAEKLATSGAGLFSTIKGKLKSNVADIGLGIVDKLKPAMSSVIALIDKASPAMMEFGGKIADGIGKGISVISSLIPKAVSGFQTLQPYISGIVDGIKPIFPLMLSFGETMAGTASKIGASFLPVINTVIDNMCKNFTAILPIMQTVFTTIGSILSSAAPIISGLVSGIGTVIQTLAPVFNTIFGGIGEKVGSVIDFIGSKMGFITDIINWAAPMISDVLTTAWSVISPVIDIVISVFKILWSVVEAVFPAIQKMLTNVWGFIKPIVEAIGGVVGGIAKGFGWIADKLTGGGKDKKVGANASGTNNWRGGLTWVGERGPELIDVPKSARILPNKESVSYANNQPKRGLASAVQITIAKLADAIIVREDADIDRIGSVMAQKILEALKNLAPA